MIDRPNIMVLGTSKAGTTSLHYYLDQHPDIATCQPKEPFYFRAEYDRGVEYYWRKYFELYKGEPFACDAAPQHLYLPFCTRRIAETLDDPCLVVICRNPTERAISAYWHNARRGLEKNSFAEAIELNFRRLAHGPFFEDEADAKLYSEVRREPGAKIHHRWQFYLDPGYYAQHLRRYISIFGKERLFIMLFEDFVGSPERFVTQLQNFIGLKPVTFLKMERLNQATSAGAARTVDKLGRIPGIAMIPTEWRRIAKNQIFSLGGGSKPQIDPATKQDLVEHYRKHNSDLELLIGRDLSSWNELPKVLDADSLDKDEG